MFLYKREGALSPELCRAFIETFEASNDKRPGLVYGPKGQGPDTGKKSTDITFNPGYLKNKDWGPLLQNLVDVLEKGKLDYVNRHKTAFDKLDPCQLSPQFNLQRYLPGEGFSSWHCERAGLKHSNRLLVWMVYLNDVTDRGETEFLYQHYFEEPKQGKLIIWPSDWMYMHRGVISPSQTKYILTGWFTYIERKDEE